MAYSEAEPLAPGDTDSLLERPLKVSPQGLPLGIKRV